MRACVQGWNTDLVELISGRRNENSIFFVYCGKSLGNVYCRSDTMLISIGLI